MDSFGIWSGAGDGGSSGTPITYLGLYSLKSYAVPVAAHKFGILLINDTITAPIIPNKTIQVLVNPYSNITRVYVDSNTKIQGTVDSGEVVYLFK